MPGNPIKKGLFEISGYFSEHTMHLLDFLTESQNAISKILGAFHGNSCGGVSLLCRLGRLDSSKGTFLKEKMYEVISIELFS